MKLTVRSDFNKLVENIINLFEGVRKDLAAAYWKTGRWIVESEQGGAVRPRYGAGLLAKLSARLTRRLGPGFSVSNLTGMRRFYLAHRNSQPAANLPLSHQIELLRIEDSRAREAFEKRAERSGLGRDALRKLISAARAGGGGVKRPADRTPLNPKRGLPDTYGIKDAGAVAWPDKKALLLDHGFKCYRTLAPAECRGLKAGDVVTVSGEKILKTDRSVKDLFTYRAYFEKPVDGDTHWVVLDIGLGSISRQKLRLRGIDCPEIDTPAGKTAKRFAESVLRAAASITVYSYKNDKYDRYEADVFFTDKAGKEVFLNNLLLEKGHAVRMDE